MKKKRWVVQLHSLFTAFAYVVPSLCGTEVSKYILDIGPFCRVPCCCVVQCYRDFGMVELIFMTMLVIFYGYYFDEIADVADIYACMMGCYRWYLRCCDYNFCQVLSLCNFRYVEICAARGAGICKWTMNVWYFTIRILQSATSRSTYLWNATFRIVC